MQFPLHLSYMLIKQDYLPMGLFKDIQWLPIVETCPLTLEMVSRLGEVALLDGYQL
jgi:hypothetical protein